MKTQEQKNLKLQLKAATKDVNLLRRENKTRMFKSLSKYSQELRKKEYQEVVSKQFDLIEKIVDLQIPTAEKIKLVERATK